MWGTETVCSLTLGLRCYWHLVCGSQGCYWPSGCINSSRRENDYNLHPQACSLQNRTSRKGLTSPPILCPPLEASAALFFLLNSQPWPCWPHRHHDPGTKQSFSLCIGKGKVYVEKLGKETQRKRVKVPGSALCLAMMARLNLRAAICFNVHCAKKEMVPWELRQHQCWESVRSRIYSQQSNLQSTSSL